MVFDHQGRGVGGHPKPNPYSNLQFLFNFLCALPFTQFVEKLYIGVVEGSMFPFKIQCTIEIRWAQANHLTSFKPRLSVGGKNLEKYFFCLKSHLKGLNQIYIKKGRKSLSKQTIVKVRGRGGGQRSMVKDHTFVLFNFGTIPLAHQYHIRWEIGLKYGICIISGVKLVLNIISVLYRTKY